MPNQIPHWDINRTLGASEACLREYQVQAVNRVVDEFNAGRTNVLLDAPVGSGKTFIAAAVMMLIRGADPWAKTMYLAGDKTLQRQYHKDFPSSKLIEGHKNYCRDPDACRDANKGGVCPKCGLDVDNMVGHLVRMHGLTPEIAKEIAPTKCPYTIAKQMAIRHNDVVTNPWYYGKEVEHVGDFAGREIAVYDECDNLGGVIDTISGSGVALFVIEQYLNLSPWLFLTGSDGEVIEKRKLEDIERDAWLTILSRASVEAMRQWRTMPRTEPKREALLTDASHFNNVRTMIVDGGPHVAVDYSDRALKVVSVDPGAYGAEHLWPTTKYCLFMTGSFGNIEAWTTYMGVRDFGVVTVPHTFPVHLRPVYLDYVGKLTGGWTAQRPIIVQLAARIKEVHRGRTLVLVSSAAKAEVLRELIPYAITHQKGSEDRKRALADFLATDNALLITTMWRGLDLKDDACRTLIIAKLPWTPKNDLVNKRIAAFPGWWEADTLAKITQGLGRGVRGPEDYCYHYIFDALSNNMADAMPAWVQESVIR